MAMRRRRFVPDALGPLESRALLTGGLKTHRGVVQLSGMGLNQNLLTVKGSYGEFAVTGNFAKLQTDLAQHVATVPFGQADGLGQNVSAILGQMQQGLAKHTPHAVSTAYRRTVSAFKAVVAHRIATGDLVVYG